ncbi:MAG: efflux RND transporter periplasmic adaptor subunit [Alphaproteobacteria bacterium]
MKYIKYIILLIIVAAGLASATIFSGDEKKLERFRTAKVTRGDISQVVTAVGTLNPIELISIGTQVSGKITNIFVNIADDVKKDQLLAEIDPSIPATQLKQSKSSLLTSRIAFEQAGRDLERTRMLVNKEYVAKVELERAEQSYISAKNSYENAKIQVERDEVNLGYTKITSPINGTIIAQEVTQGQTLASNFQTPNLFKIAGDLTKMKIDVNFSEADISQVKAGMPVKFTVDAFPDREFTGVVKLVNLNPNSASGSGVTYSVVVEVENQDRKLLTGMTAYVSVILSEKKDVLRVPAASLRFTPPVEQSGGLTQLLQGTPMRFRQQDNQRKSTDKNLNGTVYTLKDGKPEPVDIRAEATDEVFIEITAGDLKEGDTVITGMMPTLGQ